jgi:hypothetical protein
MNRMRSLLLLSTIAVVVLTPPLAQACLEPKEPLCLSPQFGDITKCGADIENYTRSVTFYRQCMEREAAWESERATRAQEEVRRDARKAREEAEKARREAEHLRAQAERAAYEAKVQACRARGGTYC